MRLWFSLKMETGHFNASRPALHQQHVRDQNLLLSDSEMTEARPARTTRSVEWLHHDTTSSSTGIFKEKNSWHIVKCFALMANLKSFCFKGYLLNL